MRGVVTLAAAAGVPLVTTTGADFQGREPILALAFLVTIATLLIQGLTLPWLIKRLDLTNPDDGRHLAEQHALAVRIADQATSEALAEYRANHISPASQRLVDMMAQRASHNAEAETVAPPFDQAEALMLGNILLEARRKKLIAARDARELDDTVMRDMLEQMDLEQAFMDTLGKSP